MKRNTQSKKRRMLECLADAKGIVSVACINADIGRKTHYKWLEDDMEYFDEVMDIQNVAIDHVESKLFECIDKHKEASIIFFLKTRGRHRGYTEQVISKDNERDDDVILPDVPDLEDEYL